MRGPFCLGLKALESPFIQGGRTLESVRGAPYVWKLPSGLLNRLRVWGGWD